MEDSIRFDSYLIVTGSVLLLICFSRILNLIGYSNMDFDDRRTQVLLFDRMFATTMLRRR